MTDSSKYLIQELLKRHINDTVTVIHKCDGLLQLSEGSLRMVSSEAISVKNENFISEKEYINFITETGNRILHIYNTLYIDLMVGREYPTLITKLREPKQQKRVISLLKPYLNKELYFIYKQTPGITLSKGIFIDMGVQSITVKVAPFYNREESIHYDRVLHIYDDKFLDLLSIV